MVDPTPITEATAAGRVIDHLVQVSRDAGAFDPRKPNLLLDHDGDLAGVTVGDGWLITNEPGSVLMIGVEDPDTPGAAFSAETRQEWPHAGHLVTDEEGEITCCAWSWNGDSDPKAARDAVTRTVTALARVLAHDPSCGLPAPAWTRLGSSTRMSQFQSEAGAHAVVLFRVWFRARLTPAPLA